MILNLNSSIKDYATEAGGKGLKLAELSHAGAAVPEFIVVSNTFFQQYLNESGLIEAVSQDLAPDEMEAAIAKKFEKISLSDSLKGRLYQAIKDSGLAGKALAVRSSGIDEDSADNSFAGMFSSFLFQRSMDEIELSLRRCWASAYSERALKYRIENGLGVTNIKMGVVIQKMVNSEISGVMFTHNPIDVLDRKHIVIDSVFGQCEGLVSGALDADHYLVDRKTKEFKVKVANKESRFVQAPNGAGLAEEALTRKHVKKRDAQRGAN